MAVVVSIINLKGGVGKSTLAMMISEYLAFRFAKRVLLIDMDAQANLSYIMVPDRSIESQERSNRTIYHFFKFALSGKVGVLTDFVARPPLVVSNINRVFDVARGRSKETLDMVISSPAVAQLDEELLKLWEAGKAMPRNLRLSLKEALEELQDQYDIILLDCPPGLSVFSSTALMASDFFISPIIPEPLSLEGVRLVKGRATGLSREPYNCRVEFAGVILNIVKHYRKTHRQVARQVYEERRSEFKPFTAWLPDNERLRALGDFEIDEERIRDGWGGGAERKFYAVSSKYSVPYTLANPGEGSLGQMRDIEGTQYKLHERIELLVEEFGKAVGIFPA